MGSSGYGCLVDSVLEDLAKDRREKEASILNHRLTVEVGNNLQYKTIVAAEGLADVRGKIAKLRIAMSDGDLRTRLGEGDCRRKEKELREKHQTLQADFDLSLETMHTYCESEAITLTVWEFWKS